jgi:glycosyltransferase involved in cell wall biosynthesis
MRVRLTPSDLWFAIPGDIATRSGGYEYDRRLAESLRQLGWHVDILTWPNGFPFPAPHEREAVRASLAELPDGSLVLIDGLAYGAMPEIAAAEGNRLQLVALVHHPLARETGLNPAEQQQLVEWEIGALRHARAVIVTSLTTRETLVEDYAVPSPRITVARPGCDPVALAKRPTLGPALASLGVPQLLSIGALIPRKGYDVLVAALATLTDRRWQSTIVGNTSRDWMTLAMVQQQIAMNQLEERITLAGEVDDLTPLYDRADIFVLASHYEGYGMVYAEALRRGLPIIGTNAGAVPEVVPETAGLLVPPGDVDALAAALRHLIEDVPSRRRLAAGAREIAPSLPRWEDTARRVATLLSDLAA